MIGASLNSPLDRLGIFVRTKTIMLALGQLIVSDLKAFGIWDRQSQGKVSIPSLSLFLFIYGLRVFSLTQFGRTIPVFTQVGLGLELFGGCSVGEFVGVGEPVDGDVIFEIVRVLHESVAPGWRDFATNTLLEVGTASAPELRLLAERIP